MKYFAMGCPEYIENPDDQIFWLEQIWDTELKIKLENYFEITLFEIVKVPSGFSAKCFIRCQVINRPDFKGYAKPKLEKILSDIRNDPRWN